MAGVATIAQAFAVFSACWAIIAGVGAWKREFVGKHRIELAEQVLAKFFEVKDAVAFIRNPFSSSDEGKSRKRSEAETDSELLDRGYIVVERYLKKENVFSEFSTLKYRCMAAFGTDCGKIFEDTFQAVNSIFLSARTLATLYWPKQGYVPAVGNQLQEHLEGMRRHEGIFWDIGDDKDEIRRKLRDIQGRLELVTRPCFEEPMKLYSFLTRPFFSTRNKK
ncbi:MAG TPA: hypothetical protein VFL79_20295 [Terriglobia bacterium]|nr:hypothetical protein [Terriglobia bacterium]